MFLSATAGTQSIKLNNSISAVILETLILYSSHKQQVWKSISVIHNTNTRLLLVSTATSIRANDDSPNDGARSSECEHVRDRWRRSDNVDVSSNTLNALKMTSKAMFPDVFEMQPPTLNKNET